jgi:hypothetical protein
VFCCGGVLFEGVLVICLRLVGFFYYSVGVSRLCAGQSLSFLAV